MKFLIRTVINAVTLNLINILFGFETTVIVGLITILVYVGGE